MMNKANKKRVDVQDVLMDSQMEINYQDYNEKYGEFSSDEEMEIENELK
jgi:hypothetical protein